MKNIGIVIAMILTASAHSQAQTMRYFEFMTSCGHGNWQDTTFIASTSDQVVIDTVLANLSKPLNQRKFISGKIDHGDGGINHNASHWFLWHFIPNEWNLVDFATEVCDGCPYTDVDADTFYWIGTIGQFCPWAGIPVREVSDPASGMDKNQWQEEVTIFPNPAIKTLNVTWKNSSRVYMTVYNILGQEYTTFIVSNQNEIVDVNQLDQGIYFVRITDLKNTCVKRLMIQ